MTCSVDLCDRGVRAEGLCNRHYLRFKRHGDPLAGGVFRGEPDVCSIEGCRKMSVGRGWCSKHYQTYRRNGDPLIKRVRTKPKQPCQVQGCDRVAHAKKYCTKHYYRWEKYGDPMVTKPRKRGTCSVDGCERLTDARGYCKLHYDHLRRNGDPTKYIERPSNEERFMSRFSKGSEDECWLWASTLDGTGYGHFSVKHKNVTAHRFSYEFFNGPIPKGLVIDHECHNRDKSCKGGDTCLHRRCVNPKHLFARTLGENSKRGNSPKMIAWRNGTCTKGHPKSSMSTRADGRSIQCLDCARDRYRKSKGGVVRPYNSTNRRRQK